MNLLPREVEKAELHNVGQIAQRRLARGVRLNHPEAIGLISMQLLEWIREGKTVAQLMDVGRQLLGRRLVMPGVASMIEEVQVEGTFPDGTKLVTVHNPIATESGNLELCLYGSFLPIPSLSVFIQGSAVEEAITVGKVTPAPGNIIINEGREITVIKVTNKGDRPIQVGSHYHFIECNGFLEFNRRMSFGKRLNILAGTAVRFEPGDSRHVQLVPIAGRRVVRGGNDLVDGPVEGEGAVDVEQVVARLVAQGFRHTDEESMNPRGKRWRPSPLEVSHAHYAAIYGPTVGDRVQLGDTCLEVEVERDLTVYGDECKFGGGKVLRDGMGQAAGVGNADSLDVVITNALIIDVTGIYKADVGLRGALIVGIGKAGNPDVMAGVTPGMVVGVNTEAIAGEGLILTAGGFDAHVHFICPQIATEAIASGLTSLLGGGTGPATGTAATTCTPAPDQLRSMLQATDTLPLNFGFTGKGNSCKPEGMHEIVAAGAVGLKLHEDWGTTPAAIRCCLDIAEQYDIQVTIHTDTLNESACVEKSVEAFQGRTIHTYHSEGAGGGHAPDIIVVCGERNVIPSSTNPTRPYTRNTIDEHLDMLMVCHHLDKNITEDVSFAESRIRGETIAAEDILHDMGAISVISSDSQAMGRVGEVICRTWHTAHKMKLQRGHLSDPNDASVGDTCAAAAGAGAGAGAGGTATVSGSGNTSGPSSTSASSAASSTTTTSATAPHPSLPAPPAPHDNFRVRRYIAKYTANPAIAHGMSHLIGTVEVGKFADLVLWRPAQFGLKPQQVIKGGAIAWAQMGDPNASVPTPEPVKMRPMFGSLGAAVGARSIAFVSQVAAESGIAQTDYKLQKRVEAVKNCRGIGKKDMLLNSAIPAMAVDPETYVVTADGVRLHCAPLDVLPLAQRLSLF